MSVVDDFESYSIGQQIPFGNWQNNGIVFLRDVRAGGPHVSTKCLNLEGQVYWDDTNYRRTLTVTFWYKTAPGSAITAMFYGGNSTQGLVSLNQESDGSLTIPNIGNSGDKVLPSFSRWNSFQLNLTFDVDVSGFVTVACEFLVNGDGFLSGTYTLGILAASLSNGLASIDRIGFTGTGGLSYLDELGIDSLKSGAFMPNPGTPKVRVTRGDLDVILLPDSALVNVAQAYIDAVKLPDSAKVRVAQAYIEIIFLPNNRWYISES